MTETPGNKVLLKKMHPLTTDKKVAAIYAAQNAVKFACNHGSGTMKFGSKVPAPN
jgi:hypothetical protein